MIFGVKVFGDKDAALKLKKLQGVAKGAAQSALRKAAGVVAKEIRRRAPRREDRGDDPSKPLRQRIKVVKPKRLRKGEVGAALAKVAAPHAHLLEQGTKRRKRKFVRGADTGAIPARPFAAPAAAASATRAVEAFRDELAKQLEKRAAKLAAKQAGGK